MYDLQIKKLKIRNTRLQTENISDNQLGGPIHGRSPLSNINIIHQPKTKMCRSYDKSHNTKYDLSIYC